MSKFVDLWCKGFLREPDAQEQVIQAFRDAHARNQRCVAYISRALLREQANAVVLQLYAGHTYFNALPDDVAEGFNLDVPRCRCGVFPYVGGVARHPKYQQLFALQRFAVTHTQTQTTTGKRTLQCEVAWTSGGVILNGVAALMLTLNTGGNDESFFVRMPAGVMKPQGKFSCNVTLDGLPKNDVSSMLFAELVQVGTHSVPTTVVSNPFLSIQRI